MQKAEKARGFSFANEALKTEIKLNEHCAHCWASTIQWKHASQPLNIAVLFLYIIAI